MTALEKLAAFGAKVLMASRDDLGCDLDGGDVQDWAADAGVLEERHMMERCDDYCRCAEEEEFPVDCFFVPADVQAELNRCADGGR